MDRRLTAANTRVAAAALKGLVEAERYVEGEAACVSVAVVDLCSAPAGARDRQLLLGARVVVYERQAGWAYVQAAQDGYVGYLPEEALGSAFSPTHRVTARATHLYPEANFKTCERMALSHGTRLEVIGQEGRFAQTPLGFVPHHHLVTLDAREPPIDVARRFLGTPYLWGGNSGSGIDCSGLVQAALWAAGVACPGDSDLQETTVGAAIALDDEVRPADLFFWKGHVAMAQDSQTLLHATAHFMAVVEEPLAEALARIERDDSPLRSRRRIAGL